MLNSLHVQGQSRLHRMPAAAKLVGLAIASFLLVFVDNPLVLAAALSLAVLVYAQTGLGLREGVCRLRPVLATIILFGAINLVLVSPQVALSTSLRLLCILVLAGAVTATTSIAAFMEVLTRLLLPLERLGLLRAADAGLAVGMVLRFVPDILARYAVLKEAHQARGVPVKIHRMLGPLIISTLRDADTIATAIDARGIRRQ
ncbi:energy-coupling factor transporter transmembrane protein EcfT [Rhizobium sp. SSA_523]|uniref:energy-coupling factor transporter transmembrane component T family protein n=1 Tax=Rhizobium sp. SSA_523 TaxID=2952477 RepID=UPI00209030FB|nr:energy-coupling factor transporter transmembrane protein EcfT [Rhizobium sp. SSA_523]MCO5731073.1 energy-coupling factor transporter transmembrane protein EcfT [Rhizobium sp. SSA_523]WKC24126.1 energy-coupling factor transporter transmembrane protein EcfT [Rhizobium sp. SSA_523]